MSASPPLSVILVCKNPGPRLPVALASVWAQQPRAPEIIVIDGASSDGTREWLEAQRSRLAVLVSEPDRGIYEAMNKGVARAQGDWVLFLGADDRLAGDRVLSEALSRLEKTDAGVLAGEAVYDDGRRYKMSDPVHPLARNFVHHQSTFYRRALFARHGPFDPSLAIMGDYEFNLRLWKERVRFESIPLQISTCGIAGASDAGHWRGYREEIAVRHRHFPAWRCWGWDAISVVRYGRKKIVRSFARS